MSRHELLSLREAPRWRVIRACYARAPTVGTGCTAQRSDVPPVGASGDQAGVRHVSELLGTGEPAVLEAWPSPQKATSRASSPLGERNAQRPRSRRSAGTRCLRIRTACTVPTSRRWAVKGCSESCSCAWRASPRRVLGAAIGSSGTSWWSAAMRDRHGVAVLARSLARRQGCLP
jgi:hypothetical protein